MSAQPSTVSPARRSARPRPAAARRRRVPDVHDAGAARQLRADRTLRRAAGLHAVQRRRRTSRAAIAAACSSTTGAPNTRYMRQVHAGRRATASPTCYALWMVMGQALDRQYKATGDRRYYVAPGAGDAVGRRARLPPRRRRACDAAARTTGSTAHPLFAQAKAPRHPRAVAAHRIHRRHQRRQRRPLRASASRRPPASRVLGHPGLRHRLAEDRRVRGRVRAVPPGTPRSSKTQALAVQAGKRLRIFFSDNNAGIDDSLIGGVVPSSLADGYVLRDQWTSYGWNVFDLADGHDYKQILGVLKTMEDWDPADRRPMIVIGKTTKGYWPAKVDKQIVGYQSHPYGFKMNADYIVGLAKTFEAKLRRQVRGHVGRPRRRHARAAAAVQDEHRRRDVGARQERPRRLAGQSPRRHRRSRRRQGAAEASTPRAIRSWTTGSRWRTSPPSRRSSAVKNSASGASKTVKIALFRKTGRSGRRAARDLRDREVAELRHRQPLR